MARQGRFDAAQAYARPAGVDNLRCRPSRQRWRAESSADEVRNALAAASGYVQWLRRRSVAWADERDRRALDVIHESVLRAYHLLQGDGEDVQQGSARDRPATAREPGRQSGAAVTARRCDRPDSHRGAAGRLLEQRARRPGVGESPLQRCQILPPGLPIVVELARRSERGRVVVRDRGIGIAAEDLEAVFDGYRTELARLAERWLGDGLRLSRRLIRVEGRDRGHKPAGRERLLGRTASHSRGRRRFRSRKRGRDQVRWSLSLWCPRSRRLAAARPPGVRWRAATAWGGTPRLRAPQPARLRHDRLRLP